MLQDGAGRISGGTTALPGPRMLAAGKVRHTRSNKWVPGNPSVDLCFLTANIHIVGLHLIATASVGIGSDATGWWTPQ